MRVYYLRFLLWKEWRELFLKNVKFNIFIVLFLTLILNLSLSPFFKEINRNDIPERETISATLLGYLLTLLPFMLILLIGQGYLREAFYREKINKTLENVLATPIKIREIWFSKIFIISILSYFMFIFITLLSAIVQSLMNDLSILPLSSSAVLFNFFVASPLLAFSVLGILGYLEFLIKNAGLIVFFIIFPLFYFFKHLRKILSLNWNGSLLLVLLSFVILSLTYFLFYFLKKEKVITNF